MPRSRASVSYTIRAEDKTRAGTTSARKNFDALAVTVRSVGVVAAAATAALVGTTGEIIRRNADVIDSYGKLSEKLGIGVSSYQAINDAAERAGIAQNTLNTSLQRGLRRTSEAAAGTGEAVKAFDELGLSAAELQQLAPEDRIYAILDALRELEDEGDRVRLASKIFDSEGVDLVRLFTSEIEGARQEIAELGLTLTEIDVAAVEAMNDEIQRAGRTATAAAQVFTGEMAPAIQAVASVGGEIGVALLGSRDAAEVFADALITGVGGAGEVFNSVRRGVIGLASASADAAVSLYRLADAVPGIDITDEVDKAQAAADRIAGAYGEIPDIGDFIGGLRERLEENRAAAEQAAADIEANRARAEEPFRLSVGVDVEGDADSVSAAVDKVRADVARDFDSLLDTLRDGSTSYEAEYRARIQAADRLRTEFPERAGEALRAEIAALEERDAVLASLGRGEVDLGVTVTGAAGDLAEIISADTAELGAALSERDAVLEAPSPVVSAPDVEAANDAVQTIRIANEDLVAAVDERNAAITRFVEPRVVIGIDLTDGAEQVAEQISDGTQRLLIETRVRGELIDSLDGSTAVRADVALEDGAPAAADAIEASTQLLVEARDKRDRVLAALSTAANDTEFGVEIDFDIQFPEFSTATAAAEQQLEQDLEVIAGYRQRFPDEIGQLAEAEALAYARRDQAIADAIDASNDAIADLQAPIQQDVSALQQSLQTEVAAIEAAYVERAAVIRDGIAFEVLAEEEGAALLAAARQKRNDDLRAIDEARIADEARSRQRLIGDAATVFGSILELQESEVGSFIQLNERMSAEERKRAQESNRRNRERFEDNKRYQAGQAFINMLAGIGQIIADPTLSYYEKIGASAATAAQGAVLIARIRSAEFGGAGSASVGSAAGAGGGSTTTGSLAAAEVGTGDAQTIRDTTYVIVGEGVDPARAEELYLRGREQLRRTNRLPDDDTRSTVFEYAA